MKKTLLLINHSQVLMELTRKIFERAGYTVRCAVGIAGANEMLMDFVPDGIILENDLPDGKGLELCCEIRKQSNVPIMFVSGNNEDELPALKLGANDYLKKPYDNEIMKARVGNMLETHAAAAQEPENAEKKKLDIDLGIIKDAPDPRQTSGTGAPEATEWKKTPEEKNRLYYLVALTTAATLIFLFFAFWKPGFLTDQTALVDLAEPTIPLAAAPTLHDAKAKPYAPYTGEAADGPGYQIPVYSAEAYAAENREMQITLYNPESNTCHFVFEITRKPSGETLYISGTVAPGTCLENITLLTAPEKGEHEATIQIFAYDQQTLDPLPETKINIKLKAK